MNAENCQLAKAFVSTSYVEQGSQALSKRQRLIKALLSQRRLPPDGWDDATIQLFLQVSMCSAGFHGNHSVGFKHTLPACAWQSGHSFCMRNLSGPSSWKYSAPVQRELQPACKTSCAFEPSVSGR